MKQQRPDIIELLSQGYVLKKASTPGESPVSLVSKDNPEIEIEWKEYHQFRNKGFGKFLCIRNGYLFIGLSEKAKKQYNLEIGPIEINEIEPIEEAPAVLELEESQLSIF